MTFLPAIPSMTPKAIAEANARGIAKLVFGRTVFFLGVLVGCGSVGWAAVPKISASSVVFEKPLRLETVTDSSVCGSTLSTPSLRRCAGSNSTEISVNDTVSHLKRFILAGSPMLQVFCGEDERGVRCWNSAARFEKPVKEIFANGDTTRVRSNGLKMCLPQNDKTIHCYNAEQTVSVASGKNDRGPFPAGEEPRYVRRIPATEIYGPYQNLRDFEVSSDTLCAVDGDEIKCETLQNDATDDAPIFRGLVGTFSGAKALTLTWNTLCVLHARGLDCEKNLNAVRLKYHLEGKWKEAVRIFESGFDAICGVDAENQPLCLSLGDEDGLTKDIALPEVSGPNLKILKFRSNRDTRCALVENTETRDRSLLCGDFGPMKKVDFLNDVTDFEIGFWSTCAVNAKGRVNCFYRSTQLGSPLPEDGSASHAAGQCRWNRSRFHCGSTDEIIEDTDIRNIVSATTNLDELPLPCLLYENSQGVRGVRCPFSFSDLEKTAPAIHPASSKIAATRDYACVYGGPETTCWGKPLGDMNPPNLTSTRKILLSANFGCADDEYGFVCWGADLEARGLNPPRALTDLNAVRDFALGSSHACAITHDRRVTCWGDNRYGQTDVPSLTNPISIVASRFTTCASSDEGVTCWGYRDDALIESRGAK